MLPLAATLLHSCSSMHRVFVHGLILFDAGSFHKSATCFLKAAATLDAALAAGVPEERCGQSSMSSKAAARSRANFANRPYLLYKAARCHIMMGEHDKAFTLLGAVPFRQRTLAIHYDYGRECQRRGKLDVAVASFKEVLRANPFAIELIAPMVRLGGSVKELEALLCGRPDVPPAVSRWLQSHIRAEAAAKDARFDFAIQQLTPLLVVAPVEDASVSGVLPAIRMDSSTAIFAAQSQATERCMPCLEPNTGAVFAYAPQGAAAEAPFILGGADSCAPLFAFGHTYVAERIMAFAAEYGDSSLCVKLNQPMGMMADPFGMPGTEFLSFALAQAVLSPAGHSHGQSQLASMCAQLKATMQTWQNNRQHSASWVVAGLLCLVQGDTHNAIRFVNTALQCDTYDELAMTVKGYILLEMGSHHAAANHFFTSNTRNPSFYCASGVVSCYVQLGNWQLALTHATNSTVSHALDHRSHALLGHTMLQALAAGADADSSELQQFDLGYSRAKKKVSYVLPPIARIATSSASLCSFKTPSRCASLRLRQCWAWWRQRTWTATKRTHFHCT